MEKILVAMDTRMTSVWSLVYALNLAKRMQVRVSILLFSAPSVSEPEKQDKAAKKGFIKQEIEKLIFEGRSEGISIDYFHTSGTYREEIIRFIQEKKIDLLVIEKTMPENMNEFVEEIKLRTFCRIELVHPRGFQT